MEKTVEYFFGRLNSHERVINMIITSQNRTNRFNKNINNRVTILAAVVLIDQVKIAKLNKKVKEITELNKRVDELYECLDIYLGNDVEE